MYQNYFEQSKTRALFNSEHHTITSKYVQEVFPILVSSEVRKFHKLVLSPC